MGNETFEVNIGGSTYRVKIDPRAPIRDINSSRLFFGVYFNVEKESDRRLLKFLEDLSRRFNTRSASETIRLAIAKLMEVYEKLSQLDRVEALRQEVEVLRSELASCNARLREYENTVARLRSELESLMRENETLHARLRELEEYRARATELARIADQYRDAMYRTSRMYAVTATRGLSYGTHRVTVFAPKIVHDVLRIVERYVSPIEMTKILEELMLLGLVEVRE